jgi:hypothetical protein
MRVYRSRSAPTPGRKRQIAYRVVLVTAALAFAIAAAALTVPELIAGNSLGNSGRRTTLGGGSANGKSGQTPTKAAPTETDTSSQTTPQQTETTSTTTQTITETTTTAPPTDTSTTSTTP